MDSGHSGSLQSSSGGDNDDYTSRTPNSLSSLIPHNPSLFDPLSDFFIDSSNPSNNPLMFNPFSPLPETTITATSSTPVPTQPVVTTAVRNPRKRSRASRRAPTTVLTTDTTNFRAMVQEFTGIPAPPFSSSPFTRAKLDLFGSPSSTGSAPPAFLLRPFAQKLPLQMPSHFHNQSSGLMNLQNDHVLNFQTLLNQGNGGIHDQGQLMRGNVENMVSNEGNLGISQEEKGASSQNVMVTNQIYNDY